MNDPSQDTIVAPATAAGAAGLAVVRLSGPDAVAIAARLFRGADLSASKTHHAHHGWIVDATGERLDEVLALVLRAPHGYTGEDTVEFSCHGSPQVVDEIVAAALAAGARFAGPGEFTRRAFLNGKLDLCQAEAVADLIAAHGRAARRAALGQLQGRLSTRLREVRGVLLELLAEVEASVDFVEEGIEFFDRQRAPHKVADAAARLDALLATAADGQLLRSGIRVSLTGAPNVGKSSLFNRLLEEDRSIVTEHPGTTRDVVRETVRAGDLAFVFEDTAGLRDGASDPAEQLGIERSRRSHAQADIVLHVVDASRTLEPQETAWLAALDPTRALAVVNKIDLLAQPARTLEGAAAPGALLASLANGGGERLPIGLPCVAVSARTGEGIDRLLAALVRFGRARRGDLVGDEQIAIAQRHREALLRARTALVELESDAQSGEPAEILALSLRAAVAAIDEISGEGVTEEILERIFARFCIGK